NRLSITEDNFKKKHSDLIFTLGSKSRLRESSASSFLKQEMDGEKMMVALQSHTVAKPSLYKKGSVGSICMHQSLLGDHTTGSMVVDINQTFPTIWITGSSTPCLAIYKPVYFGNIVAPLFKTEKDSLAYWLRYEYLLRAIYSGYVDEEQYLAKRNSIQKTIIEQEKVLRANNAAPQEFFNLAIRAASLEENMLNKYQDIISSIKNGELKPKGLWLKKTEKLRRLNGKQS
ncbi:MAG TPA: hypothetical protein VJZ51_05015, partial [Bacilli bacterium]|nr:hypothetical protein [Bacilli bacterium]